MFIYTTNISNRHTERNNNTKVLQQRNSLFTCCTRYHIYTNFTRKFYNKTFESTPAISQKKTQHQICPAHLYTKYKFNKKKYCIMNKLFFKYQGFLSHPCDSLNVISCHKSLFQKHTNTNTGFFVHHLDLCIRLHHPSRQSGEEESFLTQILPGPLYNSRSSAFLFLVN